MDNFSQYKINKSHISYGNLMDLPFRIKHLQKSINEIAESIPTHYSERETDAYLHALRMVQIVVNNQLGKEISDGEV